MDIDMKALYLDRAALERLARAVMELRGERSQREFSKLLGVAQSTVSAWEQGTNTPSLENIEKLAQRRGQLPEEFVAYLYGRSAGSSLPIDQQIRGMSCAQLADVHRAIADRLQGS